jgi:2-keto-4-pentenoate hydratase
VPQNLTRMPLAAIEGFRRLRRDGSERLTHRGKHVENQVEAADLENLRHDRLHRRDHHAALARARLLGGEHQAAQPGARNIFEPREIENQRLPLAHAGFQMRREVGAERFAIVVIQASFWGDGARGAVGSVGKRHSCICRRVWQYSRVLVEKRKQPELRFQRAAQWLYDAHARRARFGPLPAELAPRSADEAYGVQDAFVALRAQKLGAIGGYKIALSTAEMQKFVGVDAPQAGVMLESTIRRTPARVRAADYVNLIIEFEIAVQIAQDLPVADAPFFRDRVAQAVGAVMPAIELADDRGADYTELARHPLELICDNAWNEGAVLGHPVEQWQAIDLAEVRGVALINGREVGEGRGADAMGHPFHALAWIADHLASGGRGLLRGDVVITGSLIRTQPGRPGDLVSFALEGLGDVELRID